jgi:hypothetical protein
MQTMPITIDETTTVRDVAVVHPETRKVLDELEKATEGIPLPPKPERVAPTGHTYGYEFTEKDPEDIPNLNNYELQHAVFYANSMIDSGESEYVEKGKALMRRIFDEFDRRGMKGIRHPAIQDED